MMGLEYIYSFMIKRMMTVADEIFDSLKDSIIEYEQEIERLKQENCSLRSRTCSGAETCHDTQRDGGLQAVTGQEPHQCLSLLPEIRLKKEDSGGTDTQSSVTDEQKISQ
ncbi:uncharacterized protein zgc:173548 isoform X4 [Pseudorasbora parva]|uniref:uncharacterized protein zgc:173548 isoform X4 n=1 Tax=Pseudorasbora parva TaxID=51549 RepID=UPI00351E2BAD